MAGSLCAEDVAQAQRGEESRDATKYIQPMQDALQMTRFLAPRGLHLRGSVGNQGTGLLENRQLEMHGFMHNVLDGT